MKTYCTYLRVSTQKQGRSGLGLDAQRKMCADFIATHGGQMSQEFVDVESGTHRERKGLLNAINYCKQNNCPLVIAKLDRLARDVEFCFKVINTGIEIHFVDMPQINTLLLGVFASVAQYERELTSDRTKKALAVKKAQGCKLGASNENWKKTFLETPKEEREVMYKKRGDLKSQRHRESRDVQMFLKVLRAVFPQATKKEEPIDWLWGAMSCNFQNREKILSKMREFKELDGTGKLFYKWDLTSEDAFKRKLPSFMQALEKSVKRNFV